MVNRKLLRALIASLCAATGAIVACSHTAPGPADPTSHAASARRLAEGHPTDAGVPRGGDAGPVRPIGGGDGGVGVGSGSGSGSGMPVPNRPPPGAPIPIQPAPGTPLAPHR